MNLVIYSPSNKEEYESLAAYVNDNQSALKSKGILIHAPAKELCDMFKVPIDQIHQIYPLARALPVSTMLGTTHFIELFKTQIANVLVPWYKNLGAVQKHKLAVVVLPKVGAVESVIAELMTGLSMAKGPSQAIYLAMFANIQDAYAGRSFLSQDMGAPLRDQGIKFDLMMRPGLSSEEVVNLIFNTYSTK